MNIEINNKNYEVIIEYKNNKNMYLRVKKDLKIYITAPKYIREKEIKNFINNNIDSVYKQLNTFENNKINQKNKLLFLGYSYDISYIDKKEVIFGSNKVFIGKSIDIDKWYKNEAKTIFKDRLDYCYNLFEENISYPNLKIRKMTSKWGVCNISDRTITLNLELIKLDTKYLDYVIVHELCHLIYPNHSKYFWNLVSKYIDNYKKYRNEMKNII